MMDIDKQKIAKALIEFGEKFGKLNFKKEKHFTPNSEADKLLWSCPLAFLFGVILDQSMKAEKVWEIPFLLKQRLGHLDVRRIASMPDEELIAVFNQKPKLHRFPKTMALRIKKHVNFFLRNMMVKLRIFGMIIQEVMIYIEDLKNLMVSDKRGPQWQQIFW